MITSPVALNVDLQFAFPETHRILGPQRSWNSPNLIKRIMGLVEPSGAYVKAFDKTPGTNTVVNHYVPQRESVDWIFQLQRPRCTSLMALWQNWAPFQNRPGKTGTRALYGVFREVGMTWLWPSPNSHELLAQASSGCLLARSLAQNADLYLMDEPFRKE